MFGEEEAWRAEEEEEEEGRRGCSEE